MKKLVLVPLTFAFANAYAALPESVTTELDGVKGDIGTVGGLLIGLAVAVLAITWIKAMFF